MRFQTLARVLGTPMVTILTVAATRAVLLGNYVQVTPDGATTPERQANSGPYTADFTVKNIGTATDSFNILCGGMVNVTCTGVSQSFFGLAPGASTIVTATYTVGAGGNGEINLWALSDINPGEDEGYYNVPVPPWDMTMFNQDNQDVGRCAASCFAATYAQSTVPYYSLDTPRSVTLSYNGDRMLPKPFIHLNVQKPSGTPQKVWLQVKKGGVYQIFANGDTTLKFTAAASGWQRIGGQLRDTLTTGMVDVDLIVTWDYGGSTIVQTWTTKLLVVNETGSPIARGWTVAGVQRAYVQTDSSVLVTEGDGSAVFFKKSGSTFLPPTGEFSKLSRNGSGWRRDYPDSTRVFFNSAGRMTDVYDRFNNRTQFSYDGSNRLSQILDPQSKALVFTYGTYGLSTIQDRSGTPYRTTTLTVPSNHTLTGFKDPDNVSTTFQYDANLRLWKVTDRRGNTTTLAYQTINSTVTGKLATVTAPSISVYENGQTLNVAPADTFAPWQTVGVPYVSTGGTPAGVILPDTVRGQVKDARGHVTRFTVNRWGTAAVVTDALGRTDSTRFDANGLPIRVRSNVGAIDSALYNTDGLPTYSKSSGLPATLYRYVGWAQPDSMWTDDGLSGVRNFIGTNGRVDSVRVAGGTSDAGVTRYTYESHGRVQTTIDPLGHSVQSVQFAGINGNRSQDALPGSRVTTYGYDAYGRVTTVSRSGVATTTTYYSIINRPDSVRDGVNPRATRYGYDNLVLTSVTDPQGQVYGFTYNAVGWLSQRTDPTSYADVYQYSRDGELRRWTNRRGQSIDYTYDALHRPLTKSGTNTATESWAYPNDTVVVATSLVAVDTTVANRSGQVLWVSTVMAGQVYKRRYTYTAAGAPDSVIPSGGGLTWRTRRYVWNLHRGTLTDIDLGPARTAVAYNADGRATSATLPTLPGAEVVSRSYSPLHSVANITTTGADSATVNRSLGQDAADRIYRQILNATQGRQYSYDGLGRLVGDSDLQSNGVPCDPHTPPSDSGAPCTFSPAWYVSGTGFNYRFSYDSAGNRRDQGGTYGLGNRITSFAGCSYTTDSSGNVTSGCGRSFTWTAEGRLASVTASGQTTTFDYNAAGQLVRKTTAGVAHLFLWEGDNLLAELDGAGTGKIAEYSYYPGLDHPHALIVGSTKYFAHQDGMGNVIALTDSTQALQRVYRYWVWGEDTGGGLDYAGLNGKDRARFKGALWFGDVSLDLYYMRNRWYEAGTGRFLSEDPIGLAGGPNPYVYVGDDPVNSRDPSGAYKNDYDAWLAAADAWLRMNYGFGLWDAFNGTSGECSFSGGGVIACATGAWTAPSALNHDDNRPLPVFAKASSPTWVGCQLPKLLFYANSIFTGEPFFWDMDRRSPKPAPYLDNQPVEGGISFFVGDAYSILNVAEPPLFATGIVFCGSGLGLFTANPYIMP